MKIRGGFVSNSSSSSFIVPFAALSENQIERIENHKNLLDNLSNAWEIETDTNVQGSKFLTGQCDMDQFDMEDFMKEIGINTFYVEWYDWSVSVDDYDYDKIKRLESSSKSYIYCPHCGVRL